MLYLYMNSFEALIITLAFFCLFLHSPADGVEILVALMLSVPEKNQEQQALSSLYRGRFPNIKLFPADGKDTRIRHTAPRLLIKSAIAFLHPGPLKLERTCVASTQFRVIYHLL